MLMTHLSVTDLEAFKAITLADGRSVLLLGNEAAGDAPARLYLYNASSTATADDENVIEPDSGVGRYHKTSVETNAQGKRIDTYTGTTNASGILNITFSEEFSEAPFVHPVLINPATTQNARVTSVSTTGCVIHVFQRSVVTLLSIEVLAGAVTNVNNALLNVTVIENE